MGKLNYINRKIEGRKLGQVIAKDLIKRIRSKAACRDPVVELDVSGKALTDEGFAEVASALVESLNFAGEQGKVVRLEELCLRDNQLKAASLQALTPVIRLACHDLRDLDLSDNTFAINTDDELAVWEDFLTSFSRCCVLRRIDFSGSALGPRAFELLTRVYAKQSAVDLVSQESTRPNSDEETVSTDVPTFERRARALSIASDPNKYASDGDSEPAKGLKRVNEPPEKFGQPAVQADVLPTYARTQGLRSIPYLVFSNTAMTEADALNLSYIVVCHHLPQHLLTMVPPAKAGTSAQQLAAYDESQCRGVIYLPNLTLGQTGLKVLELAEAVRNNIIGDPTTAENHETSKTLIKSSNALRRSSGARSNSIVSAGPNRRRSTPSAGDSDRTVEDTEAIAESELDRARSRIQGDTLQEVGPTRTELWRVALKMLPLSRDIRPQLRNEPPRPVPKPKAKPPIVKTLDIPGIAPKALKQLTPLTTQRDPNQPIIQRDLNLTKSPWRNYPHKKTSLVLPPPPITPSSPSSPPALAISLLQIKANQDYRSTLPLGFPENVWARILGSAAGADGIMSEGQQRSVLHYAMNKETLSKERESLGLKESAQIWHVLETTGCLTYEMSI